MTSFGVAMLVAFAQAATPAGGIAGRVVDTSGAAIAGAVVDARGVQVTTAADGAFDLPSAVPPVTIVVTAAGFAGRRWLVTSASALPLTIVLEPRGITESLTVSAGANRPRLGSPASVTVLDAEALASAPQFTLDEQLRSVPGFSLFRRSSSRVANPTTQGVTLRGMSASGASRASVVADGIPLNDAFGGWVYWDRLPAAAVERVEVARGGASDVYGSDALGGAIRIDTAIAGARLVADAGNQGTARVSAFAGREGRLPVRAGAERFTTDGFVTVAPESRGPIDLAASSRHTAVFGSAGAVAGTTRIDLRAGYLSERRGNGTPFQANATTGRDVSATASGSVGEALWTARGWLTSQGYDQTFSAVINNRTAERPTSTQHVDTTARAVSVEWLRPWPRWTVFAAASAKQAHATFSDLKLPAPPSMPPDTLEARQRSGSLVAELSWAASPRTTVAAGGRGELWSSQIRGGEGRQTVAGFVPRASISFRASPSVAFRFSLQDAYRLPTMNELYRPFRVGNVQTSANPYLIPEESYGADGSVLLTAGRRSLRVGVFWAQLRHPVVSVTLSEFEGSIFRQRQNAGRIRAAGLEIESDVRLTRVVSLTASAVYTDSVFTRGAPLDGLRVPQVPRAQASAGVHATWARAAAAVEWRFTGRQFDDDRNQFSLRAAQVTDARVGWRPRSGLEIFGAVENLFDEQVDVGRTPIRTIGMGRAARVGVRWRR
ncbi:MAG: hypothetical protein A3H96_21440 [Acidobacteria bacterium RIFCSPLOWO2_02_FULL_67_36]|nr:MAG: hypothetical protein A3H96_21440 [Acidobacteria bacterium RIFCSPLOWO2_02_FULL_67_36]OFW21158.1 MAG: hypothetical protein A3G21_11035 [Acidobacteria bacterium RIFCSPLOWO2_12_FULL_66_21]